MNERTGKIIRFACIGLLCLALVAAAIFCLPELGKPKGPELSGGPSQETTGPKEPEELGGEDPVPTRPQETLPAEIRPEVTEPVETFPVPTDPAPGAPSKPTKPSKPVTDPDRIQVTGQVTSENNVVTQNATFSGNGVSAQISAGTQLESNTSKVVLTITEKKTSDSGVAVEKGQTMLPLDVHISGISKENTAPVTVCLGKILGKGMNIGNLALYHVENGVANPMTQVPTLAELDSHNQFYYDPATGDTTVAMATFSEITVLSDDVKAWEGEIATGFSGGTGTEADPYLIANADQLAYMSKMVSNDEAYAAAHYKLINNIDLNGERARKEDNKALIFYPIGYWAKQEGTNGAGEVWYGAGNSFTGVFDGNGNTIANIYQNTWLMDGNYDAGYWKTAMGLFGALWSAQIKNLTIDNFQSDGEYTPTGCIAAYAGGPDMLFENIYLTGCNPRVYNTGNGGLVGLNYNSTSGTADEITFRNVTVDQTNKISALWGSYDVSCGGILGRLRENAKHDGTNTAGQKNTVTFENCHVAAIMDVNNDVCANYQYYQYRYAGMLIGTVDYVGDVPDVGVADVITATDCTVTYGDWNEYWYCELVKNSLASYTHDHQFSRLTKISAVSEIQDENGNWNREGSFVLPNEDNTSAACYHIFKDSQGNLYQHFHDVADESNPNIYETKDINGNGQLDDLKEDRQRYYIPFGQLWTGYGWGSSPMYAFDGITVADGGTVKSEPKFESKNIASVTTGDTVKLSDLVSLVVDPVKLSKSTLAVFVSPVGEESTVSAAISIDTNNWDESTLIFSGLGAAKIVITDYFYCTPTEILITVGEPANVDKFQAKDNLVFNTANVYVGDIFAYIESCGVAVDAETITVTATDTEGNSVAEFACNDTDWTQGMLTFNGYMGTVTVTIQDDVRCNSASVTVTLAKEDRFEVALPTARFVYRVGNQNTVALGSLFQAADGQAANIGTVSVLVETVSGTATGAYTANATWTSGTIKFSNIGIVNVTISDDNYSNAITLKLEVVDAVNATTATSATKNNVVLLNNCGFSSLEVSGGFALYGNGFTMTCSSDSAVLDFGYSFVTLNSGTLDNVQLVFPNFDYAALYKSNLTSSENRSETTDRTRYYNAKSGVMASGNSQILNSRLSGARAALNVSGGNLLVENSQIELGAVANILVGAANEVRLKDVTLVQKPAASTYDSTKILMGFSVLFVCNSDGNAAPMILEGELIQYAWIDENDAQYVPSDGQSIIETVLKKTDYLHDIDGDGVNESLNLGFAYMPESLTSGVNANTVTDKRTNKETILYEVVDVNMGLGSTYVYSYKNTNGTVASFKTEPVYIPSKYNDNIIVIYADTAEGLTTGKSFGSDGWVYELNVDLDAIAGYTLDFSKLSMSVNGVTVGSYTVTDASGTVVSTASPVAVAAGGTTYTLTTTLNGVEYTAAFKVTGTETSKESPSLVAANYGEGLCVASSYGGTWHGAAPALQGIQIKYWSVAEKQYKTINLSDYTPTKTGQLNGTNNTWTYSADNGDFTLTLTGGQVHSGNQVNAMPVVVNNGGTNVLYFVAASSNGLVNSGNSARTIPVTYSFQDNNGGEVLTFSHTWSVAENQDAQYKYSDFCNGTMTKLENCITADTLITLADGSQVRVDALTGDEELLVWNLETGHYDTAKIVFIDSDEETEYEVVNLHFSDGSQVGVIYEHGFFDYNLGKYVYLDAQNAEEYIGHSFVAQGDLAENTWEIVTLTDVVIERKVTKAYSPVSFSHLCYYTDGVLSIPGGIEGLFNIFEVDTEIMAYDAQKKAQDIETYGLYTYEDFADLIPEEAYNAFNGAYLKVAIGKGMLTWEDIEYLAQRYVPLM